MLYGDRRVKRKFVEYFMDVAELTAILSGAKRLQVGCVIVKDRRILSLGYNGTPPGYDNCCEGEDGRTKPEVIHAEANAILKLAASTESAHGSVMFVTHAPCIECAKMIISCGISDIIYKNEYRCSDGVQLINKCNIGVHKYSDILNTENWRFSYEYERQRVDHMHSM
jgi:dCMP deaminase